MSDALIQVMGEEEFYAPFIKVQGERGTVLLFYDDTVPDDPMGSGQPSSEDMELANEIGQVLMKSA